MQTGNRYRVVLVDNGSTLKLTKEPVTWNKAQAVMRPFIEAGYMMYVYDEFALVERENIERMAQSVKMG